MNARRRRSGNMSNRQLAAQQQSQRIQEEKERHRQPQPEPQKPHTGCWVAASGEEICGPPSKNIFVSPEEFGHNVDTFIRHDLPKVGTAVTLAALGGVEIPLAIELAAAATSGISAEGAGIGKGSSEGQRQPQRRKYRRV